MPDLDVSFMTVDPMFCDTFDVLRRADVVGQNGRTTPTVVETFNDVIGVITQQDPAELMRADDGEMMKRVIFVASAFKFRGVTTGQQPDLIVFDGSTYIVKHVLSYSRFGGGTIEVVAESMAAVDAPHQ